MQWSKKKSKEKYKSKMNSMKIKTQHMKIWAIQWMHKLGRKFVILNTRRKSQTNDLCSHLKKLGKKKKNKKQLSSKKEIIKVKLKTN